MPVPKKKTSKSRRDKRRYQGVPSGDRRGRLRAVRLADSRASDVPHVQDVQGARDRAARGVSTAVTVALDAMGSDQGADAIVAGARDAVSHGDAARARCAVPRPSSSRSSATTRTSRSCTRPYVISHEEEPARAARERDDASVVTCMRLVREGRARGRRLGRRDRRRAGRRPARAAPPAGRAAPGDRAAAAVLEGPDRRPRHRRDPGSAAQPAAPVRAHGHRLLGQRPRRPRAARRPALERPRGGQGQPPRDRLLPAAGRRRAAALRRQHRGPRRPARRGRRRRHRRLHRQRRAQAARGHRRLAVRRDPPGRDVVLAGQARRPAAAAEAAARCATRSTPTPTAART